MSISTADLYDLHGPELASVSVQFRDFGAIATFSGPARTIQCLGGNGLVKATLTTPGRGAVLVVDGGGSRYSTLVDDLIADAAQKNGWAGVVVHGVIRDSAAISDMDFGIKCGCW